jgi:5-methylcytosine-specific restriction endonuclease McrA
MPIAPELRQFYGPTWREKVRPRIMSRAQDACECCGKRNSCYVWTVPVVIPTLWGEVRYTAWWDDDWQRWRAPGSVLVDLRPPRDRGVFVEGPKIDDVRNERYTGSKFLLVQVGVAHINHRSGDNRDENLAALCRGCHLNHDQIQHRDTRRVRKDFSRPLLAGLTPQTQTPPLGEE